MLSLTGTKPKVVPEPRELTGTMGNMVGGHLFISPPPPDPTWLEINVLWPLERLALKFLQGTLALAIVMTFLEITGLLP
jgi:hypothetical protein